MNVLPNRCHLPAPVRQYPVKKQQVASGGDFGGRFLVMSGHSVSPLDTNHTLHLALKRQKRANRDEGTGNCPSRWWG